MENIAKTSIFNPADFTDPAKWLYENWKTKELEPWDGDDIEDFSYHLLRGYGDIYHAATNIKVEQVEIEGGGEGGAEECNTVVKIGNQYFNFDYRYYSYHGFEYYDCLSECYEVFAKEKTITVYE